MAEGACRRGHHRPSCLERLLKGRVMETMDSMLEVTGLNKVSQRIFRSQQAVQGERLRQIRENRLIIHPFSQFRWYWDLIMVVTLTITLILLPVEIAFYSDENSSTDDTEGHLINSWMVLNIVVDVIFLIDIGFNFRTGYLLKNIDHVEIGSYKVAINYLKTWFVVDLVSSVPWDYLYKAFTNEDLHSFYLTLRILRFTKLLGLLRILRVARLVRYIYKIEELLQMEGKIISIVNLVLIILVFCHWNGCLQYLVAFLQGFPNDSWVVRDGLVANDTGLDVPRNLTSTRWRRYTRSLWKAMSHMLSIGYGHEPPVGTTDTWMVIVSMTLGASFYALFIAFMSGLIMSLDFSAKKYDEMISEVKQYMRFRRLPTEIQHKVLEYYDHKYQRRYFDEPRILYDSTNLSHTLRQEILMHNCSPLVAKVPFLAAATPDFLFDIICRLEFQVFFPPDTIIHAGKKGDSMFFIEHGMVEVVHNGKVVSTLGDGSYFGEIALLLEERRVASVVAVEVCDVYCLRKSDFDEVLAEHPEMKMVLKKIAESRMQQLSHDSTGSSISAELCTISELIPREHSSEALDCRLSANK